MVLLRHQNFTLRFQGSVFGLHPKVFLPMREETLPLDIAMDEVKDVGGFVFIPNGKEIYPNSSEL